jgi:hypothetical protein
MKFMGIPIDGSVNSFTASLKKKGFVIAPDNQYIGVGCRLLIGDFMGVSGTEIGLYYDGSNSRMYSVVALSDYPEIEQAEARQKYIMELLKKKYPSWKCVESKEEFLKITFEANEGAVVIWIDPYESWYNLKITYIDRVNYNSYKKKEIEKQKAIQEQARKKALITIEREWDDL